MEIRRIRDDEREQALYLTSQAFLNGSRDTAFITDTNRPDMAAFGVWDEGGLQAKVVVLDYHVHVGAKSVVKMGGIAGVSCLLPSRGKGYAGACMRHSLAEMRDAGQCVSALFPFSWRFYRDLGWEWTGIKQSTKVPTRDCPASKEVDRVRAVSASDRGVVLDVYTQYAARYRGMIARTEKHWNGILDNTPGEWTYTFVHDGGDGPDGYVTYRGGSRDHTGLREFVALNASARRGLLGLMRRLDMQTDAVQWAAPGDDLIWNDVCEWGVEVKREPKTMGRIVDVSAALPALSPDPDARGRVAFALHDPSAPWNDGRWLAEFDAGTVSVVRTDTEPQVSLSIQALSQAWFGTPTVDEIRRADHLHVHDENGYSAFVALFAGPPMWMNDSF